MGLGEMEADVTEKPARATPKKAVEMDRKDAGTDELVVEQAAAEAMAAVAKAAASTGEDSKAVHARRFAIETDSSRDELLTDFGKETLNDRYLLPGESYQDLFARVADAYADDQDHAQRLYDYISRLWFMPATPVLSNGGTNRGLPISCYLNSVSDSLEGIVGTWNENVWLAPPAVVVAEPPAQAFLPARLWWGPGPHGLWHRHVLGQRARDRRAGRP